MIVANMATFPARDQGLKDAVDRIYGQVDRLNLCLNEYHEIPAWMSSYGRLNPVIPATDLKDLGKFMFDHTPLDDVFLIDDDLHYPSDYVVRTMEASARGREICAGPLVFGYHGTIYRRPTLARHIRAFLSDLRHGKRTHRLHKTLYPYSHGLDDFRIVEQLGTGTVLVRGGLIPTLDAMEGAEKRADVRFAKWCFDRDIRMICLPRQNDFIPDGENDDVSIYKTYTSQMPNDFVDEVMDFAYKTPFAGKALRELR